VAAAFFIEDINKGHEKMKPHSTFKPWFRYPFLRETLDDEAKHQSVKAHLREM